MSPNDPEWQKRTPNYPTLYKKWSQITSKWFHMIPNDTKMPRKRFKLEFKWFILSHLAFLAFLAWVALVALVQFASKWFQVIPNDSKWFQITSKWFLPCLACTCCTHSVCAHMLGLFALAQRVFTCLSLLHSFNLCSRAGAYCTQSRFPFLALQVSIGIEPLATSYHYLLWGGALYMGWLFFITWMG